MKRPTPAEVKERVEVVKALLAKGYSKNEALKEAKISPATFYRNTKGISRAKQKPNPKPRGEVLTFQAPPQTKRFITVMDIETYRELFL